MIKMDYTDLYRRTIEFLLYEGRDFDHEITQMISVFHNGDKELAEQLLHTLINY